MTFGIQIIIKCAEFLITFRTDCVVMRMIISHTHNQYTYIIISAELYCAAVLGGGGGSIHCYFLEITGSTKLAQEML